MDKVSLDSAAPCSSSPLLRRRSNKWKLVRNVFRAVYLFRHFETQALGLEDLYEQIRQIPTDKHYRITRTLAKESSPYTLAIRDLRREQSLFGCVEKGGAEELQIIEKLLDEDPYKFVLTIQHPFNLINKRDKEGHTPLYVASKNGNADVVALLLSKGADHALLSQIGNDEESCLEVAARWGHGKVLEELMRVQWRYETVKKAMQVACSSKIRDVLRKRKQKKCGCFW